MPVFCFCAFACLVQALFCRVVSFAYASFAFASRVLRLRFVGSGAFACGLPLLFAVGGCCCLVFSPGPARFVLSALFAALRASGVLRTAVLPCPPCRPALFCRMEVSLVSCPPARLSSLSSSAVLHAPAFSPPPQPGRACPYPRPCRSAESPCRVCGCHPAALCPFAGLLWTASRVVRRVP